MKTQQEVLSREITLIKSVLDHEFSVKRRKTFLKSCSEAEKQRIFKDIEAKMRGYKEWGLIQRDFKKGDLNGTHSGKYLNYYIPNFQQEKEVYIEEKLRERGLID